MHLYILNEVLTDFTSGMAVIAAPSIMRCRELFEEEFNTYSMEEFDAALKNNDYTVIMNVDHTEGVISYVYGGGWTANSHTQANACFLISDYE